MIFINNFRWQNIFDLPYSEGIEHPANPEASLLYRTNLEAFTRKVEACVKRSQNDTNLYVNPEKSAIKFTAMTVIV